MSRDVTVGVLALQGDFAEHADALRAQGVATRFVRRPRDLEGLSGLVLPGGESSTMLKLLDIQELEAPLIAFLRSGKPVLATCAGLILCAKKVVAPEQRSYAVLDVEVARNGWGRQIASGTFALRTDARSGLPNPLSGVFIRAPRILAVGDACKVLATRDGEPVLVRQGNVLGASFHPELESGHPVTRMFVEMVGATEAKRVVVL
ncbi:MAG: pyridoxal 5'-phosphate synthase glutaminase subunit PdxT [Planctomycetes bacterium]|nr:pyridoxal 5'-phosphate synthase glutaminase subunit PdxT [Planctomycetota bacterium]